MNILLGKGGDVKVVLAFKEDETLKERSDIYKFLLENEIFKGDCGEVYSDLSSDGKHTIFLGLGEEEKLDFEELKGAFFKLGKEMMKLKVKSAGVELPVLNDLCYRRTNLSITEALLHSEYGFEKYLTEKKIKPSLEEFYIDTLDEDKEKAESGIEEGKIVIEGIFLARDLVNEPAIVMTPTRLSEVAKEELEAVGVEVEVFGREEIEELGMEAFLRVAQGSEEEPKFIVMTYKGGKDTDETLALVGKGLTYDTGGYSLKPSNSMDTMFTDMAGSAAVIGTLKSVAKAGLKKNVVGIVATCENAISGGAYKPGDIIGSMAGKTIEVANTDAEGRLTLADALWYAATVVKADKIVDIATLTGACIVALSDVATGAVTNDLDLMADLEAASKRAGENLWHLPHFKEFDERIKSTRADLINTSSGPAGAGTITAGLFLGQFVDEKPWVHLDIAGTSYLSTARNYLPKGATGIPVNTLYNLVKCR